MQYRQRHQSLPSKPSRARRAKLVRAWLSLVSRGARTGRRFVGVTVLASAMTVSALVAPLDTAFAATSRVTSELAPGDQASSFAYYKALRTCLSRSFSYRNAGS